MTQITRFSLLILALVALTGCAGLSINKPEGNARLLVPLVVNDKIGGALDINYLLFVKDEAGNELQVNLYPSKAKGWIEVKDLSAGKYTITDWAMRQTPSSPENFFFSSEQHMFDMEIVLEADKATIFNQALVIDRHLDNHIEKTYPEWASLTSKQIESIISGYSARKDSMPFGDPMVTGEYHERPDYEKPKRSFTISF